MSEQTGEVRWCSCNPLRDAQEKAEKWDAIVRCKDCKHGTQDIPSAMFQCGVLFARVSPSFFCARGERK